MKFDLSCPVDLVSVIIDKETKEAEATLFNLSAQNITSIKYEIVLLDENGEVISKTPAELEDISFPSRENFSISFSAENAENADVSFSEFTFEDGTVFVPTGETVDVSFDELTETNIAHFNRAGIFDAKCFAKEEDSYWLCVCSRPNQLSSENCVICQRSKEDVMRDFSTEQGLASAILKREESDALEARRIALEEEKIKAEKKSILIKKIKKSGIIAGISVAAIILLVLLFSLVTMLIGDSFASGGNYEKAAQMYNISVFDKTDKIANRLYGNTPTNLIDMGILAQDDENVYYLDAYYGINIKNKETGEVTKTDYSGLSLNASGGSLYFINVKDNSKIYKMTPDGSSCEVIYDSSVYYFTTVGNDIYFVSDPLEQEGEETMEPIEEEPAVEKTTTPLYVLKAGDENPELVSETTISFFTIYKNKIYYINYADNNTLYSMNLSGKGAKKIIDTPIYKLDIRNNKIYFTDGTLPENATTNVPKLTLEVANLNGRGRKTLIEDAVITSFSVGSEAIYYMDNNNQGVMNKFVAGGEKAVEAEQVYLMNVSEDLVYYLSYEGDMHLTKLDKSGYETVSSLNDAQPEASEEAPNQ